MARLEIVVLGLLLGAAAPAPRMELSSPDVAPGATLANAQVYSGCGGGNVAPALSWRGAPATTKSYAATVFDPDAQGGWWHWIVYDIPANAHALAGAPPAGARMGTNDFGARAYGGACPPPGSGVHHYRITLWALDIARLPVDGNAKGAAIEPILKAHTLARANLTATYER